MNMTFAYCFNINMMQNAAYKFFNVWQMRVLWYEARPMRIRVRHYDYYISELIINKFCSTMLSRPSSTNLAGFLHCAVVH